MKSYWIQWEREILKVASIHRNVSSKGKIYIPENGTHILLCTLHVGGRPPWQRTGHLGEVNQPQVLSQIYAKVMPKILDVGIWSRKLPRGTNTHQKIQWSIHDYKQTAIEFYYHNVGLHIKNGFKFTCKMPRTDFSRFREYRCKVLTSWARIFLHISVPKWIPYALTASSLSLIGSKAAMISAGTCERIHISSSICCWPFPREYQHY